MDDGAGAPHFRRSAEDLAIKLANIGTAESMRMEHEARDLADTFRSWDTRRPEETARVIAIRQLFELNRRAMDYLAQRSKAPRR